MFKYGSTRVWWWDILAAFTIACVASARHPRSAGHGSGALSLFFALCICSVQLRTVPVLPAPHRVMDDTLQSSQNCPFGV